MKAPTQEQLLGFEPERTIVVEERRWHALQRMLVRMLVSMVHIEREANRILEGVAHAEGCPAAEDWSQTCSPSCPDREIRLSAMVCAINAEMYAGRVSLPKLGGTYLPPTREYFDRVVLELEALRAAQGDDLEVLAGAGNAIERAAADTEPPPAGPPDDFALLGLRPAGPAPTNRLVAPSFDELQPEEQLRARAPAEEPREEEDTP